MGSYCNVADCSTLGLVGAAGINVCGEHATQNVGCSMWALALLAQAQARSSVYHRTMTVQRIVGHSTIQEYMVYVCMHVCLHILGGIQPRT